MRNKVAHVDLRVAERAAGQHGVISAPQMRELGIDRDAVSRRVAAGRLFRVHRGVYAVGHPSLSQEGEWMAAVLVGGDRAVLSHAGAAALWKLLKPIAGPIDVSTPARSGRAKRSGVRLHRVVSLRAEHCVRCRGIPVTTPARTVDDLRGVVSERLWRRAMRQAELRGLPLGDSQPRVRTRSELEDDFMRLCRRSRLPSPEVNVKIGKWEVDFLWRGARLVVETDSYAYHRGSVAFQDDHARDLDLRQRGLDVIRISERQLNGEPTRVAAIVKGALVRLSAS
jgi:very-short-patch-repair endonuclease